MRKLLNTIYVTNEAAYLTLDGENMVCKIEGKEKLRIPFENIENVSVLATWDVHRRLWENASKKQYPLTLFHLRESSGQKCAEKQKEMSF